MPYKMEKQFYLGKLINPTKSHNLNIRSNWIAIIGCIREHNIEPQSHFNKYGPIHILRQIDSYYSFPVSIDLKNTLKKIRCEKSYLKQSDRSVINRMLKNNKINDSIQIEHFNGGVKYLIERITDEIKKPSNNFEGRIKNCMEIHEKYTACCYKLVKGDDDLHANTKESDYISKIYFPQ
jgi:hypothetical protein